MNREESIELLILDSIEVKNKYINNYKLIKPISETVELLVNLYQPHSTVKHFLDSTLYLFGNGGSASDSQHIAAEFVNKFFKNRGALPAIALTTDTSVLTSIGNEETIFLLSFIIEIVEIQSLGLPSLYRMYSHFSTSSTYLSRIPIVSPSPR